MNLDDFSMERSVSKWGKYSYDIRIPKMLVKLMGLEKKIKDVYCERKIGF